MGANGGVRSEPRWVPKHVFSTSADTNILDIDRSNLKTIYPFSFIHLFSRKYGSFENKCTSSCTYFQRNTVVKEQKWCCGCVSMRSILSSEANACLPNQGDICHNNTLSALITSSARLPGVLIHPIQLMSAWLACHLLSAKRAGLMTALFRLAARGRLRGRLRGRQRSKSRAILVRLLRSMQ